MRSFGWIVSFLFIVVTSCKKGTIRPLQVNESNTVTSTPRAADASPVQLEAGGAKPGGEGDLSDSQIKKLLGNWSGVNDEIDPKGYWKSESVKPTGGTGVSNTGATNPGNTTSPTPAANAGNPGTNSNSNAGNTGGGGAPGGGTAPDGPVTFRIPAGTGNGNWNTEATTVVVKVGQTFTIQNDDTVAHQWHTDGLPCPHGNLIEPGQSATCTPSGPYNGGPLYDHNTRGLFYIRAE